MKILLLVLICVGSFSFPIFAQVNLHLKIGARIPIRYLPSEDEEGKYIATHPSQFRPYIEKMVDGVRYIIAYDGETRKIKYIQTTDRSFRTKKGCMSVPRSRYLKNNSPVVVAVGTHSLVAPLTDGTSSLVRTKHH